MKTHLRLRVQGDQSNVAHAVRFSASPVRVGRNALNDLHLPEPEVSQWHGIFHFNADKVSYIDLGSMNGSVIEGKQVPANEPLFIEPGGKIDIGHFTIEVLGLEERKAAVTTEQTGFEPPTRFDASLQDLLASVRTGAAAPKNGTPTKASEAKEPLVAGARSSESADELALSAEPMVEQASIDEPKTAFEMKPFGALAEGSSATQLFHPALVEALGSAATSTKDRPSHPGTQVDLRKWLCDLTGKAEHDLGTPPPSDEQILERVAALLRSFCQAYIELKHGARRAEKDMGVERKEQPDAPSFAAAQDAKAMLSELLSPHVDHATRIYELNRAFAELAIHQVALLSALMEGVRGILDSLSPATLMAQVERQINEQNSLLRYLPVSARRLWTQLGQRHRDLQDTDGFTRELFGARFARAYYAFAGQRDAGPT